MKSSIKKITGKFYKILPILLKANTVLLSCCESIWKKIRIRTIQGLQTAPNFFKTIFLRLKFDNDKRRLQKLPWYLVLGSFKSGKKSLISNLQLYFAQAKHFGVEAEQYTQQFSDYDWWFSEQAILIDVMSSSTELNNPNWKLFIKLLKRLRKHQPINGIILTFSLPDILLYSNQTRQEFIQDICLYIREIHNAFKSQVAVYLIFTKTDLVEGFMEFFNELSKEELGQIWGMTLPFSICNDIEKSIQYYNDEFARMVDTLRNHVLWSLDAERNPRGRELICSFPQQLQLLRRPIETFIMELFGGVRYKNVLLLRGIYFGSNKQEGEAHDFLLQAMSKKFQLVPPKIQRPQRIGECYFLRQLFHNVIYPEAKLFGESERSRKMQLGAYYGLSVAAPIIIIASWITMHYGYIENIQCLTKINHYLTQFRREPNIDSEPLIQILPELNSLDSALQLYHANVPISMHSLFETKNIRNHLNQTFNRMLTNVFMPRVAATVEDYLNQNIVDQNLLYATLKAYLAFSPSSNTHAAALVAPLEYHWNRDFKNKPKLIHSLRRYLELGLQLPIVKLPLDGQLISRIRDELEAIIPSERAYGLLQLKASVADLPQLYINSVVGQHFDDLFEAAQTQIAIPALYTEAGYKELFLAQYQSLAAEVSEDNQAVGLTQDNLGIETTKQIITAMQQIYERNFIKYWIRTLTSLKIKSFTDINSAISTLQLLISSESPLQRLLTVLYDNTNSIPIVSQKFASINQFQNNKNTGSWQTIQQTLFALENMLRTIQRSPDRDRADYQAIVKAIQTGKSPIIMLTEEANHAPAPLKQWLNGIADSCWTILVNGAHNYVNTIWQNTVIPEYNANIAGRYPIVPHANADISINDFNQFFSPNGILANFFNNTLKPFIQADQSVWSLYQVQGHDFQMNSDEIALFQQAYLIQSSYFNSTNHFAKLAFSIKPLLLDANASSSHFIIGRSSINYSHGPQETTNLIWPFSQDNQRSELILSSFNGAQYSRSATGPWAIFKLLDQGSFSEEQLGNYIFSININGHNVSYQFFGSGDKSIYQLSSLKNFYLPNTLVGVNNARS